MRRVTIEELRTGDRLGRDVSAHPADELPLLRAGNRISDSQRTSLQRAGVVAVWIEDALSDGINPLEVLDDETKRRATAAIHNAFTNVAASLPLRGPLSREAVMEMSKIAQWIIRDVTRTRASALALGDLANADSYTLKHSLNVTTLGLALGLRVMYKFGWVDVYGRTRWDDIEERLIPLGVGLLLHDIGTLAVPQEIMQKSGRLTEEEVAAVRMHPMAGVEILKKAHGIMSPLSRAVVRSHHERWDGSGYPEKKAGTNIHQFARIAAVADVYDALTSARYHRKARAAHDIHAFIVKRAGRLFDPQVVEIFRSFVAPYPPGTPVVLSDGYCGLVKEVRQEAVLVPVVRIIVDPSGKMVEPRDVDLATVPGVTIVSTNFAVPVPELVPA